ncbi:MAG: protoheme IX farnesyltransferase [Alphaproteobacteria bacterium]|uniref:Protoheme IX farnesyltransferase n=1 Tax=Candidatus Nitrobium versatile TaxID=2884831 RepID=A0A953M1Z7_9BACT|nr:protoheme IX farnesyltransferase [Candidatus Nitrobium versatile]
MKLHEIIRAYCALCKPRITLLSTASAAAGFLLAPHGGGRSLAGLTAGVLLLAGGSCALNHYMDRHLDRLMPRTWNRPLPAGRIRPCAALLFSLVLVAAGLLLLVRGSLAAAVLGAGTAFWYNCFYTYLKRKSAFAAVPGGVAGALPPAIGWVSAGGGLPGMELVAVCSLLFLWQIPHSWLLALQWGREYEGAGIPSVAALLSREQLTRVLFVWINAAAVTCLLIPLHAAAGSPVSCFLFIAAAAGLSLQGIRLFREDRDSGVYRAVFRGINFSMAQVMFLIILDKSGALGGLEQTVRTYLYGA